MAAFNKAKGKDSKKLLVLDTWFIKNILPKLDGTSSLPAAPSKPAAPLKSSEPAAPVEATASKPAALPCSKILDSKIIVGETMDVCKPKYLDKILMFEEKWLDKVLRGDKWLELRKTRLFQSKENQEAKTMYAGTGSTIHGWIKFGETFIIETKADFEALRPAHQWVDDSLPYSLPCAGHLILEAHRCEPLKFDRLTGTQGRCLYRPLGWIAEQANKGKDQKDDEGHVAKPEAEKGTETEVQPKAAGKSKKGTKKPGTKVKKDDIKVLAEKVTESQTVEVVQAANFLKPTKSRLENKMKFMKEKERHHALHISGGLLAHMTNAGTQSAPQFTASFLLGTIEDTVVIVHGGYLVPQKSIETVYEAKFDSSLVPKLDLKKKKKNDIVGFCIVKPEGHADMEEADLVKAVELQKEHGTFLVTVLTGKDNKSKFYRINENGLKDDADPQKHLEELHVKVHWVGERSLYFFTDHQLIENLEDALEKTAQRDVEKAGQKNKNCRGVTDKEIANAKRRRGYEDTTLVTAEDHMRSMAESLQTVASWIVDNMAAFATGTAESLKELHDGFRGVLDLNPLAKQELLKVQGGTPPADVAAAGKTLATILDLKTRIEVRCARREANSGSSFCGNKGLPRKRTCASSTSSTTSGPSLKRLRSSNSDKDSQHGCSMLQSCHQVGLYREMYLYMFKANHVNVWKINEHIYHI